MGGKDLDDVVVANGRVSDLRGATRSTATMWPRTRRGQDDHGGAPHQGADRPRRRGAVFRRLRR